VLGLNGEAGTVYCLDFGLAKLYRDRRTLRHLPKREGSLAGTPRCVCVFVWVCVCVCVWERESVCEWVCMCVDVWVWVCLCVCVLMCVCEFVCVSVWVLIGMSIIYRELRLLYFDVFHLTFLRSTVFYSLPMSVSYLIQSHAIPFSTSFDWIISLSSSMLDMHPSTITWELLRAAETTLSLSLTC
jgi:hypothetical protein